MTSLRSFGQSYRFEAFGTEDGLGNLAVLCLAQDKQGYIWVGTLNGLYRYDGNRFQYFSAAEGLPDPGVHSLAVTKNGSLWVGTGKGVAVFRNGRLRPVDFGEAVGVQYESSLAVDPQSGELWLATTRGAAKVDSDQAGAPVPHARFLEGVPRKELNSVGIARDGAVWFGDSEKLYRCKAGDIRAYGPEDGVPKDSWQAILSDREGTLWARSATHLMALKPHGRQFLRQDQGLPSADFWGARSGPRWRDCRSDCSGAWTARRRQVASPGYGGRFADGFGLVHDRGSGGLALDRDQWRRRLSLGGFRGVGELDGPPLARK